MFSMCGSAVSGEWVDVLGPVLARLEENERVGSVRGSRHQFATVIYIIILKVLLVLTFQVYVEIFTNYCPCWNSCRKIPHGRH